jgi:hypothetical protein
MAKTITVTCEGGATTVETRGFVGKACLDATAELEKALGVKASDTKTPEFHEKTVQATGN